MNHPTCLLLLSLIILILILSLNLSTALDTITPTQPLTANNTLTSADSVFELGFFSPDNTDSKLYIGIWYKNIPTRTIVWVANTESPLANSTALLKITGSGNLALAYQSDTAIWQTNVTTGSQTVAQLLDTGNLVVRPVDNVDPGSYLWQSFHYPTDTLLPGMKLGLNKETGTNRFLTSWRTRDDPGRGDYVFKLNSEGFPAFYLWQRDMVEYRSGPWNGLRFSGVPEMGPSYNITFNFLMNRNEVSYSFDINEKSMYSRLVVNSFGILQRLMWIDSSQSWNLFWYAPADQCDFFMECGPYGVCDTNHSPICKCIKGFEPKNKQAWALRDGSGGCVRNTELNCGDDGFLSLKNMKLPESSRSFFNAMMGLGECAEQCRKKCSCTAYANMDIRVNGSGCVMWTGDLMDMRQYAAAGGGQEMFVRVSANVLDAGNTTSGKSSSDTAKILMAVGIAVGVGLVVLALILFIVRKKKKIQRAKKEKISYRAPQERSQDHAANADDVLSTREYANENRTDEFELPIFDFGTMLIATENFCDENKVGQGGFGIVYKGMLGESQQIAVKRLSKTSVQGIDEFKNEVRLIARLQHRNLVRLLGCCVEMEEKMLIYEYMENKSLDSFLFKKEKSSMLDWQTRFNIISGIARGLLYLHQDSRFRIIHRDLKASNILLDKDMNPKISDFGMARIFGGDQTEANTKKVVGTYGYMSPEYAMDGLFSIKSDVFSFGVLVMEIVTGKKNRGFYNVNLQLNLLGHAWKLWKEGKAIEIIDPSAGDKFSTCEVLRCIQVGLLCVQERAEDRPNMSSVVLMLGSENPSMPQPKNPGFCVGRRSEEMDSSWTRIEESCTVNQLTVTILDGR